MQVDGDVAIYVLYYSLAGVEFRQTGVLLWVLGVQVEIESLPCGRYLKKHSVLYFGTAFEPRACYLKGADQDVTQSAEQIDSRVFAKRVSPYNSPIHHQRGHLGWLPVDATQFLP